MLSLSNFHNFSTGHLEVISGPMFSGKTEELIRRVRRAQIARVKVQVFRPSIDNRYNDKDVVSHSSQSIEAIPVKNSNDIWHRIKDSTRIVAIDEVQFFDNEIIKVVTKLTNRGHRLICAGLDLDYRAKPFGPMPALLAMADEIVKVHAICTICGGIATRSQRVVNSKAQLLVGATEAYEARCRAHFEYSETETEEDRQEQELLNVTTENANPTNNSLQIN
ncbi:MAG: thymidine kinase [Oligoflexia bacterium]|nr:thymidine kinase [Oligoflexia bacterium]